MERAGEPALARPAALDDLDAAMAARVLERAHAHVVGAHHDDRLVEDLVLDEVVRLRDLLEPARHLPDPRPQQLGLHRGRSPGRSSAPCGTRSGNSDPSRTAPGAPTTSDPRSPRRPTGIADSTGRYNTLRWTIAADVHPTSTCWSSAPASPASTSCTAPAKPASPCSCSRPAAAWAAPGTGTATPARGSTPRATPTRYLFSKELFDEWEWQEHFAEQPETERYLNHVVDRFDLRRHIRFDAQVTVGRVRRGVRARGPSSSATAPSSAPGSSSPRPACSRCRTSPTCPGRDDFRGESATTPGCGRRRPSTSRASASPSSAPDRAACS